MIEIKQVAINDGNLFDYSEVSPASIIYDPPSALL